MSAPAIDLKRVERDLEALAQFSATPGKGVTRLSLSPEAQAAKRYLLEEARKAGAAITALPYGNLRARLGADVPGPSVMVGSHIDSVVHGGRYDGAVGVVLGLEVLRVLSHHRVPLSQPVDLLIFEAEEGSRFGPVLLGSKSLIGTFSQHDLREVKDERGISYYEAAATALMDLSATMDVPSSDRPLAPGDVAAMLEVHVEQGGRLESCGAQIGIVTGITGVLQRRIHVRGTANHAGTTPMDGRRDALAAASEMILAVETTAREYGDELVATVGRIVCEPNIPNVIPGSVSFTLDIRSPSSTVMELVAERLENRMAEIAQQRGVAAEIVPVSTAPPVRLSPRLVKLAKEKVDARGLQAVEMWSGAVHDALVMTEITDVAMLFIPSRDGLSHCPEEYSELEDIGAAGSVLLDMVLSLAAEKQQKEVSNS